MYVTPAALSDFAKSGASNCTQRTDDFVSGSRTQTCAVALCVRIAPPAPATAVAEAKTTTSSAVHLGTNLLTYPLLLISVSDQTLGARRTPCLSGRGTTDRLASWAARQGASVLFDRWIGSGL